MAAMPKQEYKMAKFKKYIPPAKQRAYRQTLQYQVIIEDICAVFKATEVERELFEKLINGMKREEIEGIKL